MVSPFNYIFLQKPQSILTVKLSLVYGKKPKKTRKPETTKLENLYSLSLPLVLLSRQFFGVERNILLKLGGEKTKQESSPDLQR